MNELESKSDWEDRLVNLALEESLGGQSPPDLSDEILAASSRTSVASLELGEQAMNDLQHGKISRRKHWVMFAAAASLLVAVGMLVFIDQFGMRHARMAATTKPDHTVEASDSLQAHSKNNEPAMRELMRPSEGEQSSRDLVEESDIAVDLDAALPANETKNQDKLLMMATPQIILQQEGSESLSLGLEANTPRQQYSMGRSKTVLLDGRKNVNASGKLSVTDAETPRTASSAPAGSLSEVGVGGRMAGQKPNSAPIADQDLKDRVMSNSYSLTEDEPFENSLTENSSDVASRVKFRDKPVGREIGLDAEPASVRDRFGDQLGRKITEYQQLARRSRSRNSKQISERVSALSAEIDDLRRTKRRYEAQQGSGPGTSGDQYARIYENPFVQTKTSEENFSTFSVDVDTASYANVRRFLMRSGQLPPPDAVRIEELVNYFDYDYSGPTGDVPFASHVEVAGCPWNAEHRLVRIGIKGKEIERGKRPQSNLVFLIDVSGSMNEPTKLPLLVEGMKLLTRELGENDKVAIVVYASSEGLALESTRGDKQQQILSALNKLRAGGSTAGGAGIELAYKTAVENHIEGGVNRVILCTDGDFNVGVTSTSDLERMAEDNAKDTGVFLTVLGFGRGNLNDSMMERISGKGNGNYHYVDNLTEARKVLVEEMAGTLVTIAKDVKIQIDFNPYQVAGYRLLGYENRMLRTEDFNDDKKDAGEIGAGHTVTALYEIVPAGKSVDVPPVDASKYVKAIDKPSNAEVSEELLTLRIRYKQPDADVSTKQEFPVTDQGNSFTEATPDFRFASAVASFGMLLRDSEHKGNTSFAAVKEIAQEASERDQHGYRAEFLQMVDRAKQLSGE